MCHMHQAVQAMQLGPRGLIADISNVGLMAGAGGEVPGHPEQTHRLAEPRLLAGKVSPEPEPLGLWLSPWGWVHHTGAT